MMELRNVIVEEVSVKGVMRIVHNKDGNITEYKMIDKDGNITKYDETIYNEKGDIIEEIDHINSIWNTKYYYDDKDRLIKTVTDNNTSIEYTYDDKDNLLIKEEYTGTSCNKYKEYRYDENNNIIYECINNDIKEYIFDENNRCIKRISKYNNGISYETYYTYDEKGNVIEESYSNEDCKVIKKYDERNNLIYHKAYNGCLHTYNYDDKNRMIAYSSSTYDIFDEINIYPENDNSILNVSKAVIKNIYDEKGNIIKKICDYGTIDYEYDENNRHIKSTAYCNIDDTTGVITITYTDIAE